MRMTGIAVLLTTLLTASAAAPRAERHTGPTDRGSLSLAPGPDGVRIPIDLRGNHIYFRGRIDDSDSLWMVLDSGASANVIDAGVARALGLATTSIDARGAGGRVEAGLVQEATLRLPGATLTGAPITTMPLESFKRQTGRAMEAIIGHPLMDRCVVRIDYLGRTLELLPADTFEYTGKGIVLPLTFEHRLPYITARLTLPGRKPVEGRFVIDLGSSRALILSPTFVKKEKVLEAIPKTIEARGRGVGGPVTSRMGRVARLDIGGIGLDQLVTTMPISETTHISAAGTTGNIGGEILRRFTVTFDYPRKRMILEPNARLGEPFEGDMSGIAPRMGPDGSGALEVEWIQPVSPAAEAGVRPNDLIERIDGRPALEVGVPGLREMFLREGATYRLLIRRGDERIEVALTTRRLI